MKRLFWSLLALLILAPLGAQETIDLLVLSGRYGLPQSYNAEGSAGKATEWGSVNSLTAGFNVGKTSMIAINVNHFYFHVTGDPEPAFPDFAVDPVNVNGLLLRVGLRQDLGKGRTLQVLAVPRLMSDFKNLDGNSFQMGAVATYGKRYSEDFSIGFGVIFNAELFGPYVVPLVDLNWKFADRWRLKGLIPVTGRLEFSATEHMLVGWNHFGLITTYYLGDEAYAGDYLERQSIDESLFIRHRVAGNIFMEFMAGMALGRTYRQFEADQKVDFALPLVTFGDDRAVKNEFASFDDGLILNLKLIYNIPLPE